MQKVQKYILTAAIAIIVVIVSTVLCISPITKYLIEKYDVKYTGREITMDWAYVNPFTGYIQFNNIKISESKNDPACLDCDSVFFSASDVIANLNLSKLFSKTIEFSKFTLVNPKGIIIQTNQNLNFDDLITRFSSGKISDSSKSPFHFSMLRLHVINGEFHYRETRIPVNYYIKQLNFESPGILWNTDTVTASFSFLSGTGDGKVKGKFTINTSNLNYCFSAQVEKFDLNIIQQYLNELSNFGNFKAQLNADLQANGNFTDAEDISLKGKIAVNDFHCGKSRKEDYASFEKLTLEITALNPKNHVYLFDSVSLNKPFFKYEQYDHLDNIENMFGSNGVNISAIQGDPSHFNLILEIARYVKVLASNFFESSYKINRLAIYNGDLKFNDYSISEKFSMDAFPMNIIADSIDKNHPRVAVSFNTGFKPYGMAFVNLSINPKDSGDFDLQYHFQKLPIAMFNPYVISYTSFPLDRGTIEFEGKWNVRNGIIKSDNHLLVIDPRVAKRRKNKGINWIPMPLAMSFIRARGDVIDYEIPITGNLKNPEFHLSDVLSDLLENIFVKPVMIPYRSQVKQVETKIENFLTIKWPMRQFTLTHKQELFIKQMSMFLNDNPEATIEAHPQQYALKEKEYMLYFEAKKIFFLSSHKANKNDFSQSDSVNVDKMSVKDSLFVQYLNKQVKDTSLFTIEDKCNRLVGKNIIDANYNQLNNMREDIFLAFFTEKSTKERVKFIKPENLIPYNGFSFYRIEYNGEYPESLITANRELNELNNDAPRKFFKKERNVIKNASKQSGKAL